MTTKAIVFSRCADCPYFLGDCNSSWACNNTLIEEVDFYGELLRVPRRIEDPQTIPEWCELNDVMNVNVPSCWIPENISKNTSTISVSGSDFVEFDQYFIDDDGEID